MSFLTSNRAAMAAITFGVLFGSRFAQAESVFERTQRVMDEAARQAKEDQRRTAPQIAPMGTPVPSVSPGIVDPSAVAARYREQIQEGIPQDELLVFVSTAMPRESLRRLGQQAAAAGAVIVLRGFKGGLAPGALQETLKDLAPIAEDGASIEINPEAFSKYGITAVPAFVLATREQGCVSAQCQWQGAILSGDVSLDYALEHWEDAGGTTGAVAGRYLLRMQRN